MSTACVQQRIRYKTALITHKALSIEVRCAHWRRQLWGTGARAPLDFQLVKF